MAEHRSRLGTEVLPEGEERQRHEQYHASNVVAKGIPIPDLQHHAQNLDGEGEEAECEWNHAALEARSPGQVPQGGNQPDGEQAKVIHPIDTLALP